MIHEHVLGGSKEVAVTAEDTARVNSLTAAINAKIGGNFESFEVVKAAHQCVNGTNHFYHINGNPGGVNFTVTIYEPLQGGFCGVEKVTECHTQLCLGHGQ